MKEILKGIIGFLIGNRFTFNLFQSINRDKLLIVYYHRIIEKKKLAEREVKNMCVDLDNFDAQMKFLSEHYNPISEEKIAAYIEKGRIPDYSVWITFDDGYKDNYTNAYPILRKYRIPATFFITTGYINKTAIPIKKYIDNIFMNWNELIEASKTGIFIGAHTRSHEILSKLSEDDMVKEIFDSKNEIEQKIGKQLISFAYPVGKRQHYYLEKCTPILKKNNFKLAVTTIGGFNTVKPKKASFSPFNLKRVGLSYEDTLNIFRFKISLGSFWQR